MFHLKVASLALPLVVLSSVASRNILQPSLALKGRDKSHGGVLRALLSVNVAHSNHRLAQRQELTCPSGTHLCSIGTVCCPDGFDCVGINGCCPTGEICVGDSGDCVAGAFMCPGDFCCFTGTECGQGICLDQTTSTQTGLDTGTTTQQVTEAPPKATTKPKAGHAPPRTTARKTTKILPTVTPSTALGTRRTTSVTSSAKVAAPSGGTLSNDPTVPSIAPVLTTPNSPTNTLPASGGVGVTTSVPAANNGGVRGHATASVVTLTYAITVAFAANFMCL